MAIDMASATATTSTTSTDTNTNAKTTTVMKTKQKEKTGLRKVLKKWREKMISIKKVSPTQDSQRPGSSPKAIPVLVEPTAKISVSSSLSRENSSSNARKPSQSSDARPLASRRNTAPADYFPQSASVPVGIPVNTITTTISAAQPRDSFRRRSRMSILKRSSSQVLVERSTDSVPSSFTPVAPPPSAPTPASHTDRRATFQFTTGVEVAARTKMDEEKLKSAADIVRRDKSKDQFDPERRERDTAEDKSKKLTDSPSKKWEWGR